MRLLREKEGRLVLIVPDEPPLRAAARTVRASRSLGTSDGHAVFDYPVAPDIAEALTSAFAIEPEGPVADLCERARSLGQAVDAKKIEHPLVPMGLKTEPYVHQVQAFNFAWTRWMSGAKGTALLMEQGTGKSLVAIALANALYDAGRINWVMVVCPNSLRGTWGADDGEIALHSATSRPRILLTGTRQHRAGQLAMAMVEPPGLPWIITNYEQFSVDIRTAGRGTAGETFRRVRDAVRSQPGLLICDESTMVKNLRARRTQAMAVLAEQFPYRLILTGTPITRSPLDAFAQFEVMERGCLGFNSYLAFERAYATYSPLRVQGGRQISVPSGYQNLEDLERRLARMSYRARAADCLDLPPVIVRKIPVTLSSEQARTYRTLRDQMMAEADDGTLIDGRNILTRYGKLAQIVGGQVRVLDEEGAPAGLHSFDPNPKLDALREQLRLLFEDPDAKAVVFAQYVPEVESILAMCRKEGWGTAAFYGDVSVDDREAGRVAFANDPDCRVLVAQYQCGSKGLNLTAANTVIFYSLTFSLEDYLQAQKRVHRSGQKADHVNEVYLIAEIPIRGGETRPTIDNLVLQALREKKDLADVVTGDRAREVMEAL